jgi:hypothetical protein
MSVVSWTPSPKYEVNEGGIYDYGTSSGISHALIVLSYDFRAGYF